MLIQVLCKYLLDLTCRDLSTYFAMSKIHLPTEKRRYRDSNLDSFSPCCSKLAEHVHSQYHLYFYVHLAVNAFIGEKFFSSNFFQTSKWIHTFFTHQVKFFIAILIPATVAKVLFQHPFVYVFGFFCFTSLALQQCNELGRNIYQLHVTFTLITLNLMCIT